MNALRAPKSEDLSIVLLHLAASSQADVSVGQNLGPDAFPRKEPQKPTC